MEDSKQMSREELESIIKAQNEKIDALVQVNTIRATSNEDEGIDPLNSRTHPETLTIRAFEGLPIVGLKIKHEEAMNPMGQSMIVRSTAYFTTIDGKEHKAPFGGQTVGDYLNITARKPFKLVDCDPSEKTGASSIKRNVVVSTLGKIPETEQRGNEIVPTGRMINQNVYKDIREYTIEIDGEKYVIGEDDIAS